MNKSNSFPWKYEATFDEWCHPHKTVVKGQERMSLERIYQAFKERLTQEMGVAEATIKAIETRLEKQKTDDHFPTCICGECYMADEIKDIIDNKD